MTNASVARIFLSSTFRDFGEERELLAKRIFPALRKRLQERFVELVDVDLRWGITPEAAERGEVLPICLAEIDRSRPWFIGMLGERYGWVPPADKYDSGLIEQRPWLAEHQGGKSVTELEILHAVLNDPEMAGRAFFYFRAPAYARRKGGDYVSASSEDAARLASLKDRIRASGFPVVEDYPNPEALAERIEADLWAVLDQAYPKADTPDAFTREQRRHEAYASPRRRLYLGGECYQTALDEALASGEQRILIGGHSGGGKSALIANWVQRRRQAYPAEQIHEYYLGASVDAASPVSLVRHLIERIKRITGSQDEISADPQALFDSLPIWLADASAHAGKEGYRWIITLDGLNGVTDLRDLRWLPGFLPERVHLLVSCLPGEVRDSLAARGTWQEVDVQPLTLTEQRELLQTYLGHYNKTLEAAYEARVLSHPLAANPLFLRTLAEELRLFGRHEDLSDELDRYLSSLTVDDLFERVLERVEQDCGARRVKAALTAIWASRAGLAEEELLAYAGLVPATWAPIRLALDDALLESGGRLTFAHDYMRIAVSDRYMAGHNALRNENQSPQALALRRKAHERLATWFTAHALSDAAADEDITIDAARAAEEIPYQWWAARNWRQLKKCLTERAVFEAFLEHRTGEELLGLWLDIEANNKTTLEGAYQVAWKQWKPDTTAEETGNLANTLAEFLREAGRYRHPLAQQLAELALTIAERALGTEDLTTCKRLNGLARLLQAMGNHAAAEPLLRRALAISLKTQGPEQTDTGNCLNNLALLLQARGDYSGAEPLYHRALASIEKLGKPAHALKGRYLNNLALLLRDRGESAKAEPLLRQAVELTESILGQEHPSTSTMLDNLALVLASQGAFTEAEFLHRRALMIAERVLGSLHPDTAIRLENLAGFLRGRGAFAEAETLIRRALAITERVQGPAHPATGMCLHSLAMLFQIQGDYASAKPLYRRAIAIFERSLGAQHFEIGSSLNNLALLLHLSGDPAGAEPLYRRVLNIFEKTIGMEHANYLKNLQRLYNVLLEMDRFAEAEPLLHQEIEILRKNEGDRSLSLANSYHQLGIYLRNAGRLDEAEGELHHALAIREADEASGANLAYTLNALGKVYALRGNKSKALEFYKRGLEVLQAQDEPDEADITQLLKRIDELNAD